MKIIVQRVSHAEVTKVDNGEIVGKIDNGYLVLLGIKKGDTFNKATKLVDKLLKLRVMSDASGRMNLTLKDVKGEILVVSQFTLYADTNSGNRPSFLEAEESDKAIQIYEKFISDISGNGINVQSGSFGDYMKIDTSLDGPVTIIYED